VTPEEQITGAPTPNAALSKLELLPSRQFPNWLAEQNLSLAFTTYQTGKLFLVGVQPNGRLSIFERSFNRAMGLWTSSRCASSNAAMYASARSSIVCVMRSSSATSLTLLRFERADLGRALARFVRRH
jgi:hypothetical protein